MHGERGFTLVEVMVATLLLTFGMLAFFESSLLSLRIHRRSRALSTGVFLAQGGLERIGALGWESATRDRARASIPDLMGDATAHPQETINRAGQRFLLVYTREESAPSPALCVVRCYWAEGNRSFEAHNVVRLAARER